MIEDRLYHFIAGQPRGATVTEIAETVFNITFASPQALMKNLIHAITMDKRFTVLSNGRIILSEYGTEFDELFHTTYVALDVETTGSNSRNDRITELGAIKIEQGAITDSLETLINPGRYIPYDITNLTGITNEMVYNAPVFEEVVERFHIFIQDSVLIAHNASFDVRFINCELNRVGTKVLRNKVLCTCQLSKRLVPELHQHSLNRMARFFGIVNTTPHRAGSDAVTCGRIFLALLYKMPEKSVILIKKY